MKMYFSSESFHTELTADKVYYTSKMLVQNITNQMSASKMMRKKNCNSDKKLSLEKIVAEVI